MKINLIYKSSDWGLAGVFCPRAPCAAAARLARLSTPEPGNEL